MTIQNKEILNKNGSYFEIKYELMWTHVDNLCKVNIHKGIKK